MISEILLRSSITLFLYSNNLMSNHSSINDLTHFLALILFSKFVKIVFNLFISATCSGRVLRHPHLFPLFSICPSLSHTLPLPPTLSASGSPLSLPLSFCFSPSPFSLSPPTSMQHDHPQTASGTTQRW
jgi:hypothetical protein